MPQARAVPISPQVPVWIYDSLQKKNPVVSEKGSGFQFCSTDPESCELPKSGTERKDGFCLKHTGVHNRWKEVKLNKEKQTLWEKVFARRLQALIKRQSWEFCYEMMSVCISMENVLSSRLLRGSPGARPVVAHQMAEFQRVPWSHLLPV